MKPVAFLIALLLSTSVSAAATIYRWRDAEGQIHFTQTPPAVGIEYETLRGDAILTDSGSGSGSDSEASPEAPAAPAAPSAEAANREFLRKAEEANKAEAEAKAAANAERAKRDARCKEAQARVALLESAPPRRFATPDANGQYARLNEDEYAKLREDANKAVADSCR